MTLAAGADPANQPAASLLDRQCIEEIRRIEHATGRKDVLSGFVVKLEAMLKGFGPAFSDALARGDTAGAQRAAHTLKGTCRQLGAQALGELFADIERSAKAGDYAAAQRSFDGGAELVERSLEALRRA